MSQLTELDAHFLESSNASDHVGAMNARVLKSVFSSGESSAKRLSYLQQYRHTPLTKVSLMKHQGRAKSLSTVVLRSITIAESFLDCSAQLHGQSSILQVMPCIRMTIVYFADNKQFHEI